MSYSPKVAIANSLNGCGTMSMTNDPTARIGLPSRATSRATSSAAARNTAALTIPETAAQNQNFSLPFVFFAIAGPPHPRGFPPCHLFAADTLSDCPSRAPAAPAGSFEAMTVTVRQATKNDARAIATVRIETWRAAYEGLIDQVVLDRLDIDREARRRDAGFEHAHLWVLEGNDRAAAFYERHGWCEDGVAKDDDELIAGPHPQTPRERRRVRRLE